MKWNIKSTRRSTTVSLLHLIRQEEIVKGRQTSVASLTASFRIESTVQKAVVITFLEGRIDEAHFGLQPQVETPSNNTI